MTVHRPRLLIHMAALARGRVLPAAAAVGAGVEWVGKGSGQDGGQG